MISSISANTMTAIEEAVEAADYALPELIGRRESLMEELGNVNEQIAALQKLVSAFGKKTSKETPGTTSSQAEELAELGAGRAPKGLVAQHVKETLEADKDATYTIAELIAAMDKRYAGMKHSYSSTQRAIADAVKTNDAWQDKEGKYGFSFF